MFFFAACFDSIFLSVFLSVKNIIENQQKKEQNSSLIKELSEKNSEPKEIQEKKIKVLDRNKVALDLYNKRKWKEALQIFSELRLFMNSDNIIEIYKKSCEDFQIKPPNESWKGTRDWMGNGYW